MSTLRLLFYLLLVAVLEVGPWLHFANCMLRPLELDISLSPSCRANQVRAIRYMPQENSSRRSYVIVNFWASPESSSLITILSFLEKSGTLARCQYDVAKVGRRRSDFLSRDIATLVLSPSYICV